MYKATVISNFDEMEINQSKEFYTLPMCVVYVYEQLNDIEEKTSNERQMKFAKFLKSYLRSGVKSMGFSIGRYQIGFDIISSIDEQKYLREKEKEIKTEIKEEKKRLSKLKREYKKLQK